MPDRHQLGHPRLRLPFAGPASSQPASRPARMRAVRSPPTIAALSLVSGAGRNPSGRTLPRDSAGRGGRRRAAPGPREETPPVTRGRLGGAGAGGAGGGGLVFLYYVLPLDEPWNGDTAVRILIGLLVFAGITVWQVKAIAGSRYPAVKAIEALGLIVPLYLLLFASPYFVLERAAAANFTQPLTRTDALYFAVTVFSTVGFGDIAPRSEAARVVLIVQMLGDLALLGAGARVLLGAVRRGQQRGQDPGGDAGPAAS